METTFVGWPYKWDDIYTILHDNSGVTEVKIITVLTDTVQGLINLWKESVSTSDIQNVSLHCYQQEL